MCRELCLSHRYLDFALYINVAWLGAGMIWLSVFLINVTASHRRLEEKQRLHSRVRSAEHRSLDALNQHVRRCHCCSSAVAPIKPQCLTAHVPQPAVAQRPGGGHRRKRRDHCPCGRDGVEAVPGQGAPDAGRGRRAGSLARLQQRRLQQRRQPGSGRRRLQQRSRGRHNGSGTATGAVGRPDRGDPWQRLQQPGTPAHRRRQLADRPCVGGPGRCQGL